MNPTNWKHLYETPIYKRCSKGAGFKKYTIDKIMQLPTIAGYKNVTKEGLTTKVMVSMKGNHFKHENSRIFAEFYVTNYELVPVQRNYYTSMVDYFVYMEADSALHKRHQKRKLQYRFELNQIKTKYPEYFLWNQN